MMQLNRNYAIAAVAAVAGLGYMIFGGEGNHGIPENIAYGNGRIEAVQVDISTKIPGRVKEVLAVEGDLVKSGQSLAKIDAAQLRAQLMRAEADIASAKATLPQPMLPSHRSRRSSCLQNGSSSVPGSLSRRVTQAVRLLIQELVSAMSPEPIWQLRKPALFPVSAVSMLLARQPGRSKPRSTTAHSYHRPSVGSSIAWRNLVRFLAAAAGC